MKEAKRHGAHRCGNCSRTIKLRHDAGRVACTAHLTVVSVDHAGECGEYEAAADRAQPEVVPAATSTEGGP